MFVTTDPNISFQKIFLRLGSSVEICVEAVDNINDQWHARRSGNVDARVEKVENM